MSHPCSPALMKLFTLLLAKKKRWLWVNRVPQASFASSYKSSDYVTISSVHGFRCQWNNMRTFCKLLHYEEDGSYMIQRK